MSKYKKYSAAELLGLNLNCLPQTVDNILKKAKREGWEYIEEPSRGRFGVRRLYDVPDYVLDEINRKAMTTAPTSPLPQPAPVAGAILNGAIVNSKQLAFAMRALDEYLKENGLVIDEPEVKAEIVAILYKYLQKDATGEDLQELLRVVMR